MINAKLIDEISNKINKIISSTPASEVEKAMRALLQGTFEKLELVSREEFDVQAQILLQTRNKLSDLEQKLAELEARLASKE